MGETGRELSCVQAQPSNMVEEIASSYLLQANGNPSLALRRAIEDALADFLEAERRTRRAERLISRGFIRSRPPP